ncbi:hypothetical protein [Massilia timonae]|uniref:hypothetical protein n=1 Tax=Massilia timonae TaxID=47229 RepID=UPI001E5884F7|nr:hypothetical protein [Massilia timonae]
MIASSAVFRSAPTSGGRPAADPSNASSSRSRAVRDSEAIGVSEFMISWVSTCTSWRHDLRASASSSLSTGISAARRCGAPCRVSIETAASARSTPRSDSNSTSRRCPACVASWRYSAPASSARPGATSLRALALSGATLSAASMENKAIGACSSRASKASALSSSAR